MIAQVLTGSEIMAQVLRFLSNSPRTLTGSLIIAQTIKGSQIIAQEPLLSM